MDEFWFMGYERAVEDFLTGRDNAAEFAERLSLMGMSQQEIEEELSVGTLGDMSPYYAEAL